MTYLLDSNICIGVLNQQASLIERLSLIPNSEIGIPSVVVGELSFGACKSQDVARSLAKLAALTSRFDTVPFDFAAAHYYGNLKAMLYGQGKPIGPNDFLIAATALARNATLVTRNVREFSRVPALRWVEW